MNYRLIQGFVEKRLMISKRPVAFHWLDYENNFRLFFSEHSNWHFLISTKRFEAIFVYNLKIKPTNRLKDIIILQGLQGTLFLKQLRLDATHTSFRRKHRILYQISRTYSNSEVYISPWRSTYQESDSSKNTVDRTNKSP